jgi:hypothetical protein
MPSSRNPVIVKIIAEHDGLWLEFEHPVKLAEELKFESTRWFVSNERLTQYLLGPRAVELVP